jgi:predicted dehydrogenase
MLLDKRITRRDFLKGAAVAVATPCVAVSSAVGAEARPAPSERVGMGCIGVGGRGTDVMRGFLGNADVQVIAVCDCFDDKRESTQRALERHYAAQLRKGTYKGCTTYRDFRELLAREDIDAVLIATPDHWHVLQGIAAARAGKDMYVEKPLSVNIAEGRALCDAVKRYGRVFQFGTQQRSDREFRFACELVRNGRIGELHTIKVGSPASGECGVEPPMPIPAGFDYDMWLGPAPRVPYTEKRCQTPFWYFISDYTMGFVSGWGVHHVDIAQWGNGTDATTPVEIEGEGVFPKDGLCDTATAWEVECKYANGVKMIFADNRKLDQGVRFEGTEGWVFVKRGAIDANPKSLLSEVIGPDEVHLGEDKNHCRDFLDSVKSRKNPVAPIEAAHHSNSICQLSDIAIRTKRKLMWNPDRERFMNDPEADRFLSRAMRSPWHL